MAEIVFPDAGRDSSNSYITGSVYLYNKFPAMVENKKENLFVKSRSSCPSDFCSLAAALGSYGLPKY
jgi:hypothetical protein